MEALEWQGDDLSESVLQLVWWAILPSQSEVELLDMQCTISGRGERSVITSDLVQMQQLPDARRCADLLHTVGHTRESVLCAVASRLHKYAETSKGLLLQSARNVLRKSPGKTVHAYMQLVVYLQARFRWRVSQTTTKANAKKRKRGMHAEALLALEKPACNGLYNKVCASCMDTFATFLTTHVMKTEGQLCADRFFFGAALAVSPEEAMPIKSMLVAAAKISHTSHVSQSKQQQITTRAQVEAATAVANEKGLSVIDFLTFSRGFLVVDDDIAAAYNTTPYPFKGGAVLRNLYCASILEDPAMVWTLSILRSVADASMLAMYIEQDNLMWKWRFRADSTTDDANVVDRLLTTAWVANCFSLQDATEMPPCCVMMCAVADTAINQADIITIGILSFTTSLCCATVLQQRLAALRMHEHCAQQIMLRMSHEYASTEVEDETTAVIARRRDDRRALLAWRTGISSADVRPSVLTTGAGVILSALGSWLPAISPEKSLPVTTTGAPSQCECLVVTAYPARGMALMTSMGGLRVPFAHTTVRVATEAFRGESRIDNAGQADITTQTCTHGHAVTSLSNAPWRYHAVAASFERGDTSDVGVSEIHRARCMALLASRDVLSLIELPKEDLGEPGCAHAIPILFPQLMLELFMGDFDGTSTIVYDAVASPTRAKAIVQAAAVAHCPVVYVGVCPDIMASRNLLRIMSKTLSEVRRSLFPGWFVGLIITAKEVDDICDDDGDDAY